ncbi:hypothetical protein TIN2_39 [Tsukamurella phage TIN2]|uniref:Uncharacterized protein n=1 Tax=Tsukamurella phage TIN2 TaxID=1636545 RepID=A0A0K0N5E7_9CAUD|nr:hypothetical protein AVT55_gp084 [Tsukamurella phage TIN2]AKJ71729.1 hypothetical protein TIN2_39 [Tsukamurella phage TIN2]
MKLTRGGGRHRKHWWTRAADRSTDMVERFFADRISALLATVPAY